MKLMITLIAVSACLPVWSQETPFVRRKHRASIPLGRRRLGAIDVHRQLAVTISGIDTFLCVSNCAITLAATFVTGPPVRGQSTTRRVPLSPPLMKVLKAWVKVHPGGSHTFCHDAVVIERSQKCTQRESGPIALTGDEAACHFRQTVDDSK